MTYPLVRHLGSALPNDLGDPLLNTWILAWDADRLLHGLRGLWDAPIFYPYTNTLAYLEHLLGIAVLTAPVQWLSGNPVLVYNFAFLLSYVLAGSGMYLLAKSLTGSRSAAVLAGVAFAFAPYRVAQAPHLQVLMSGWMPIGLWALHRYFATGSWAALMGFVAAFVFQGLSNGYYLYFFSLPVVVVVVYELIRGRQPRKRAVVGIASAAVLILLTLVPIASVYYEVRREQGLVRSRDLIQLYSADLTSYLHISDSLWVWGGILQRGQAEGELFPGATVLALAAVALAVSRARPRPGATAQRGGLTRRHVVALYAAIGLLAFLLSLGPEPTAWGTRLLATGPYDWLLAIIPGLDGLRVPARIAMIVYLALAVLAAVGMLAIFGWLSRSAGAVAWALFVVAILAEGYRGPMPCLTFEPQTQVDDYLAYEWLRRSPPGGVLELPMQEDDTIHTLRFQFATLQHRHPMVNGFSGYRSPLDDYLVSAGSPLFHVEEMPNTLRGLRALGVQYIVVHASRYGDRGFAAETISAIRRSADQVRAVQAFGATTVFRLTDWPQPGRNDEGGLRQILQRAFRASASLRGVDLPLAFDGDLSTRWMSRQPQMGDEWIEIEFDRQRNVARVVFDTGRGGLGDYPRQLLIESSKDGDEFVTLYHGSVLPQLLEGLVRDSQRAPVAITLPPNQTRMLRLRQTGHTRVWHWSIHELMFWER